MNELIRHKGVALIEVLVAFAVFSVGEDFQDEDSPGPVPENVRLRCHATSYSRIVESRSIIKRHPT